VSEGFPMNLSINVLDVIVEPHDGGMRVRPIGDLCIASLPVLRTVLDGILATGEPQVVELDLAACRLLTSAAVDLVEEVRAKLEVAGGVLVVTGATGLCRRVLEILGCDYLLAIGT
jgi:hypothetical protein